MANKVVHFFYNFSKPFITSFSLAFLLLITLQALFFVFLPPILAPNATVSYKPYINLLTIMGVTLHWSHCSVRTSVLGIRFDTSSVQKATNPQCWFSLAEKLPSTSPFHEETVREAAPQAFHFQDMHISSLDWGS